MSDTHDEAETHIIRLALAAYRDPLRVRQQLRFKNGLPAGLAGVLKIAGSEGPLPEPFLRVAGTRAHKVRPAARFLIEQVLFCRDASHYRVLGLDRDATPDAVREHYRLVMRLVHPDRRDSSDGLSDNYAERVNEAYAVLRDPLKRREYDRVLRRAGRGSSDAVAGYSSGSQHRPAGLSWGVGSWRMSRWLLSAAMLIAVLLVAGLFWSDFLSSSRSGDGEPDREARVAARVLANVSTTPVAG